jgi:hypothetical protein
MVEQINIEITIKVIYRLSKKLNSKIIQIKNWLPMSYGLILFDLNYVLNELQ